jgi:glycosyltransferase involved in cell wall biosynthesis
MDADLQNDPADIPILLTKIDEGYDVVSGWRQDRWKEGMLTFFTRRIPSAMANWLISRVTGVYLHDYGCALKTYRSEVVREVRLYGDLHRFIPAIAPPVRPEQVRHWAHGPGIARLADGSLFAELFHPTHSHLRYAGLAVDRAGGGH